jgi:hypothetical protein
MIHVHRWTRTEHVSLLNLRYSLPRKIWVPDYLIDWSSNGLSGAVIAWMHLDAGLVTAVASTTFTSPASMIRLPGHEHRVLPVT